MFYGCCAIPIADLQSQTLSHERNRRRTFVFAENGLRDPELATLAAACHATQSSLQCREHVIVNVCYARSQPLTE